MGKLSNLSIILITRNSKSVLFDCLKALDNNDEITSSKNAEWIVVDNNSNDGSIDEVIKDLPADANGIPSVIREEIERDISDFIYKNIKINEVHGETHFPSKVYETTIRIAF